MNQSKIDAIESAEFQLPNEIDGGAKKLILAAFEEGARDEPIAAFRHAVLEFDYLEKTKQWGIMVTCDLPITDVIDSGNRALQAWVRVDAKNRADYYDRVTAVYDYVKPYVTDSQNKNPCRRGRLPGCIWAGRRQKLLELNVGCWTFEDWLSSR